MTLHVSLPAELEKMVHDRVKSGMYGSASEVVREALRNMFAEEEKSPTEAEWEMIDSIVLPRLKALQEGTLEISGTGVGHLKKLRNEVKHKIIDDRT